MSKPTGGRAFPKPDIEGAYGAMTRRVQSDGMTVRTWLAGQCLAGFCARVLATNAKSMVSDSVALADALISELGLGDDNE